MSCAAASGRSKMLPKHEGHCKGPGTKDPWQVRVFCATVVRMRTRSIAVSCLRSTIFGLITLASRVDAQELEPRAFSPNPTGVNYMVLAYSRSSGGVLFDPSVPVTDVDAHFSAAILGYGHTFGIL